MKMKLGKRRRYRQPFHRQILVQMRLDMLQYPPQPGVIGLCRRDYCAVFHDQD